MNTMQLAGTPVPYRNLKDLNQKAQAFLEQVRENKRKVEEDFHRIRRKEREIKKFLGQDATPSSKSPQPPGTGQ